MFKFLKKWYMSRCVAQAAEAADITHLASDLVEHFPVLNYTTCRVAHTLLKKQSTAPRHLFRKLDIARLATHPESLEYSREQWKLLAHMARLTSPDDDHFGRLWTEIFTHPKLSEYATVVAAELCPERAFSQDQQQRIMQEFQSVYAQTNWRYFVTSEKIYGVSARQ